MPSISWLSPGSTVEVMMTEEGLLSSKYRAKVLSVVGKKAEVEHEAFNEEGSEEALLHEWVPLQQLAPVPPEAPPNFIKSLRVGVPLEVTFEDGWWEVNLDLIDKSKGAACYLVGSAVTNTCRWVEAADLRPAWSFDAGQWQNVTANPKPPPPPAEKAPPAARKAGGKSKAVPASSTPQPAAKRSRGGRGSAADDGDRAGGGRSGGASGGRGTGRGRGRGGGSGGGGRGGSSTGLH